VWSPIAGGLLSGKYRRGQATPEGTRVAAGWKEPPIRYEERLWRIVDVLLEIGEARGVSGAQIALAWLLGRPGVTSLVVGGRNEAQFRDNLTAAELKLNDDERARLDRVSQPPVIYPYWHQSFTAHRRFSEADMVMDRTGAMPG
jgi:aryl-alcohol dehydrogenase-like predicted oxidoreductase